MSQAADLQSDEFMQLLSEALRAGPGSPSWHEAVRRVRQAGGMAGDEYALLMQAREDLESGRAYRSIQAGPDFTRKVLEGIDEAGGKKSGLSTAGWMTLLSGVVVAVLLGVLIVILFRGGRPRTGEIEDLANTTFINTIVSDTFDGSIPSEWRPIGSLELKASQGLRPVLPDQSAGNGGGLVLRSPMEADQMFKIEADLRIKGGGGATAQVFIADQPQFSKDRGTSPHELVWLVRGSRTRVILPGGVVANQAPLDSQAAGAGLRAVTVRILMGRDLAIIDADGKRLWAGEHHLDPTRPRYIGIRFLRPEGHQAAQVSVRRIRIMKP